MPHEKTELIPWVPAPVHLLLDDRLSTGARLLFMILQTWDLPDKEGHRKGVIWPSLPLIAERARVDRSTVCRQLAELEKFGMIHTELKLRKSATRNLTALTPAILRGNGA
jgi:hypothetical protein